jgi:ATP-dependent exoDNAse (exonuclease V) alpha subunit
MGQLLLDWQSDAMNSPASSMILAIRNCDVLELNDRAQWHRKQSGLIKGPGVTVGRSTVYCGDRIIFGKNDSDLGVCNGQLATVLGTDEERIVAHLDSGQRVLFAPAAYPHIQLAYALTTCKAQGVTVERAFVYVDTSAETRETAYVQASRVRESCSFYAVADTMADLVPCMARSRPKVLASSLEAPPAPAPTLSLELAC